MKCEYHSTPRGRPHRNLTILLTLPLVAVLYGIYSRQSFVRSRAVHADQETNLSAPSHEDEDKVEDKEEDEDEVIGEEEEPLEDFLAYSPPVYDRHFWPSPEKTTEKELSQHSRIFTANLPCGIARHDLAVVSRSLDPACFSSSHHFQLPSHYWFIFGIYDSHNGNLVASQLTQKLPFAIVDSLVELYSKHATLHNAHVNLGNDPEYQDYWSGQGFGRPFPPPEDFDASISRAFHDLDREIVHVAAERALEAAAKYQKGVSNQKNQLSFEDAASLVSNAHCGSSAAVAIYETDTRQLRLANTGDSRAVLGRCVVDDKGVETYELHVLAHDLAVPVGFADDPPRRSRAQGSSQLHAFGDGPWKWSKDVRERLNDAFPFIINHDHPYAEVTAQPEIITFETQPGDFLVLGSRGLWSSLSYEEAVGLVGLWLKRYRKVVYGDRMMEERDAVSVYDPETSTMIQSSSRTRVSQVTMSSMGKGVFERRDLPVQLIGKNDDTFMYRLWGIPKKFVVADRNVAQHLVRNALGGANADTTEALLLIRPPRSRDFRDDVSVQVMAGYEMDHQGDKARLPAEPAPVSIPPTSIERAGDNDVEAQRPVTSEKDGPLTSSRSLPSEGEHRHMPEPRKKYPAWEQ
ncbi:hypothetical protein AGABI1DRAFT_125740 [Agaricus bisporus var. burnettii JB137-S8]|uniref:PPM-type phosphatase domain-containing protein n=1 Tax=Agaricus bisporus var. burnettii (strain JB137-S8 / ATCC MYA-4627 / FGSC 10392) TaxID=597362 RepID=K5Y5A7_AGABU|nr:uncharacterized protein AGABI1DRAFT_125740 [Agaricus bisporus var. burnettii JB137-S8]EKM83280.1 hypothetical protein AGABI1DRAFT_125740 [Agaricus bisporus var. burnettii JB137-S8]